MEVKTTMPTTFQVCCYLRQQLKAKQNWQPQEKQVLAAALRLLSEEAVAELSNQAEIQGERDPR